MSDSGNSIPFDRVRAVEWREDCLHLIDQRVLPAEHTVLRLETVGQTAEAITDMVVRGAPAIGISAAYGVVLAARHRYGMDPHHWKQAIAADLQQLAAARPTAINLGWAIHHMKAVIDGIQGDPLPLLLAEAQRIHAEDIAACHRMGQLGAAYIQPGEGVLTHCNTGALATGGYGTALGVIRAAAAGGQLGEVYADETRPWLQGARLTAWELVQEGIPVKLLADGAAAHLMKLGKVAWVIVGSDRIAANGDVANKIGTYSTAVLARHHGLRFMVVAPTTTVDMATPDGAAIPIEQRPEAEVLGCGKQRIAADGAAAWNPAFDVTPAELVDVLVTEKGVVERPNRERMAALMAG